MTVVKTAVLELMFSLIFEDFDYLERGDDKRRCPVASHGQFAYFIFYK